MENIKKFLHDKLKWGYRVRQEGFTFKQIGGDSYYPLYECRFCGGTLAQDSQGNWFHLLQD